MTDQEFIKMNIKNSQKPFDKTMIMILLVIATMFVIIMVLGTMPKQERGIKNGMEEFKSIIYWWFV